MTLRSYLWGMRVSTFFALSGWAFIIMYIDPESSAMMGQALFYLAAFLSFSGIFALFLAWFRGRYESLGNDKEKDGISISFRQGVLLALLVVILLFMQKLRILVWWDGMLAAAGIFLIELYFLSHRK